MGKFTPPDSVDRAVSKRRSHIAPQQSARTQIERIKSAYADIRQAQIDHTISTQTIMPNGHILNELVRVNLEFHRHPAVWLDLVATFDAKELPDLHFNYNADTFRINRAGFPAIIQERNLDIALAKLTGLSHMPYYYLIKLVVGDEIAGWSVLDLGDMSWVASNNGQFAAIQGNHPTMPDTSVIIKFDTLTDQIDSLTITTIGPKGISVITQVNIHKQNISQIK